jgi:hypothetical protein
MQFWNKIIASLLKIAGPFWDFIRPVIIQVGKDVGPEVLKIITDAVTGAELMKNPTSEKKWQQAFDTATAGLKDIGATIPTRTVNLLIEAAVQKLPSKTQN